MDTDTHGNPHREKSLKAVRSECYKQSWRIAQSNPCFEVWLYYHQAAEKPTFEEIAISKEWKKQVNDLYKGGFNPKKHPILVQTAIKNAEAVFCFNQEGFPDIATTEVFNLAQSIMAIGKVKMRIETELENMKK